MYTSVAAIALAHFIAAAPSAPRWTDDYWQAQKQGRAANKPLAVFVGSGPEGFHGVSREGRLAPSTQKVLAERFVCVYLNKSDGSARKIIRDLEISANTGLVISDRSGQHQAFFHDGQLDDSVLEQCVARYGDPNFVVRGTETNVNDRISYYPPQPPPAQTYRMSAGRSC